MITNIKLNNFKVHQELDIMLGNLTLLTGANGMGKSSVIQSLLLLRQSYNKESETINGLKLNGTLWKTGTKKDILCDNYKSDGKISIKLESSEGDIDIKIPFDAKENDKNYLESEINTDGFNFKKSPLFGQNFHYINAFRLKPQALYPKDTETVEKNMQLSCQEGDCFQTVYFLHHWGERKECECIDELLYPEDKEFDDTDTLLSSLLNNRNDNRVNKKSLKYQVEQWLQKISPEVKLTIKQVDDNNYKLSYKFTKQEGQTNDFSAENVGFGITYTLPILVAILSAKPGAMILIENPEAHIHPGAISALMDLVIRAIKAGIQIVIETHSDHVINGMLVKVAQENREEVKPSVLTQDITKVYFFTRNNEDHTSEAIPLQIMEDGRIVAVNNEGMRCKKLPQGFFDQINKDLREIMGVRRM